MPDDARHIEAGFKAWMEVEDCPPVQVGDGRDRIPADVVAFARAYHASALATTARALTNRPPMNDLDLLELAWGLIANASDGDWSRESLNWRETAEKWRDLYHQRLKLLEPSGVSRSAPPEPEPQPEGKPENPVESFIAAVRALHPELELVCQSGKCFRFHLLLREVFPSAQPFYDGNHVITEINGEYWDIRGRVDRDARHFWMKRDTLLYNRAFLWDTDGYPSVRETDRQILGAEGK